RIKDIQRIERLFYGNHYFDSCPMFLGEIANLSLADAVLARAGAVHAERPLDQPIEKTLHGEALADAPAIEKRHHGEIAAADMPNDGRERAAALKVCMGFPDA